MTITTNWGSWRKYVFSTDHKMIGFQYGLTGLVFLFFGFMLMLIMRWQLAHPGVPVPDRLVAPGDLRRSAFEANKDGVKGVLTAAGYNSFGAMHGTIMVFFGIVPIAFAAFGNFVVPLQIGAPDMAFPRINMASYWSFFISCVIMSVSFFVPGRRGQVGLDIVPAAGRHRRRSDAHPS